MIDTAGKLLSAPEAPEEISRWQAQRSHRKHAGYESRPGVGAGPKQFANQIESGVPAGTQKSSMTCTGGFASLHHRLISAAPPGRYITSRSSPAVSMIGEEPARVHAPGICSPREDYQS